jgi:DNA adenine methylase
MINEITSPPVQYTGSKWRIAKWIIERLPAHVCYVEPFCGAAGVFFRKPPSPVECLNDLNGEVINFFDVLRSQTNDLIRAIELTPWSRVLFIRARSAASYTLERGLRQWGKVSHLYACAERLKLAQIEHDGALNVIKRFDDYQTLFYCDPPYVMDTRTSIDYPLEMTDKDHEALAASLHSIQGMALISGYSSKLYDHLYADWHKVMIESRTVNNVKRVECLWLNPAAQSRQAQKRLF